MLRRLVTVVVFVLAALLVVRNLFSAGVPALHHDWNWPIVRTSPASILQYAFSPWFPNDAGGPQLYVSLAPLIAATALLNGLFAPLPALLLMLGILLVSIALGAYALARVLKCSPVASVLAGLFYIFNPAVYDELVAGHLGDLCMYAGLPLLLAGLLCGKDIARWRAFALASAGAVLASVQPQGFALAVLVIVVFVCLRGRRAAAIGAVALAAMVLDNLPWLLTALWANSLAPYTTQDHAILSWESVQSSPFLQAIVARGYAAGYDRLSTTYGSMLGLFAAATIVWLAIEAVRRRSSALIGLLIIYVAGILTLGGLKGPAAGLWAWAFVHVLSASLFRELFHAAPLVTVPMAIGFAFLADEAGRIKPHRLVPPLVCGALGLCAFAANVFPSVGGTNKFLHGYKPSQTQRAFYALLDRRDDDRRYTFFPGRQPFISAQGSVGIDAGGYYSIGDHAAVFGYIPTGPIAYAADNLAAGNLDKALPVLQRLSVGYMLVRRAPQPALPQTIAPEDRLPGITYTPVVPAADRITQITANPRVRVGQVPLVVSGGYERLSGMGASRAVAFLRQRPKILGSGRYYELERNPDRIDEAIAAGCMTMTQLQPSTVSASPTDAFVAATRYGFELNHLDDALQGAVVTAKPSLMPALDSGTVAVLAFEPGMSGFLWLPPSRVAQHTGVLAIAALAQGRAHCSIAKGGLSRRPPTLRSLSWVGSTHASGEIWSAGDVGALTFTDRFDTKWNLTLDGRPVPNRLHFEADGFANGWILDTPKGPHHFEIDYAPSRIFAKLLFVQACIWAMTLAGLFLSVCKI